MISIADLADELDVSPDDIRTILADLYGAEPVYLVSGLMQDGDAADVRAVLDPDGVRVAR